MKSLNSMNDLIQHDISNLLYSISINYDIDLEILKDRYLPIINLEKKKIKFKRKINRSTTLTSTTQPHYNVELGVETFLHETTQTGVICSML